MDRADQARVLAVITELGGEPGALLPVLHAIQDALGYVPPAAVPLIADGLNLSRAEVHGVISFYHYFRDTPPGRHTISPVPRRGVPVDERRTRSRRTRRRRLGVDFHETTADGAFTFEPVYCLGNCACSPAVMVDGQLHGRVTPERFDAARAPRWETRSMPESRSYVPRRFRRAVARRRRRRARDRRRAPSAGAHGRSHRPQRLARHCTGSSRSSRWRRRRAASPTARSRRPTCPACSTPASSTGGTHRARARPDRRDSRICKKQERLTFARVGIIDPVEPRRLPRARRLRGPAARPDADAARTSCRKSRDSGLRGRGGAAFPDRHQVEDRARRAGRPEVRHLQRRRGRLGHVRRSHAAWKAIRSC